MIKQIQLRGISRTPSDRMSEDGGLSESLNMYLDSAENAPAFVPVDVTTELGLPADLQAERIFIHKTANYENYIVVQDGKVVAYTPGIEDEEPMSVLDLEEGEEVSDITSVGNTLIISTTSNLYYVLYKNRTYVLLGNKVPFPMVTFHTIDEGITKGGFSYKEPFPDYYDHGYSYNIYSDTSGDIDLDADARWDEEYRSIDRSYPSYIPIASEWEDDKVTTSTIANKNVLYLLDKVSTLMKSYTIDKDYPKAISGPVFIRYAVELYDGSVLSSMPIFVNPFDWDKTFYFEIMRHYVRRLESDYIGKEEGQLSWKAQFDVNQYSVKAIMEKLDLSLWSDIILKINIYSSIPTQLGISEKESTLVENNTVILEEEIDSLHVERLLRESATVAFKVDKGMEEDILALSSSVYKISEFVINPKAGEENGINKLIEGFVLEFPPSSEVFASQQMLAYDDMKHNIIMSEKVSTYNNRLFLLSTRQILAYDYIDLNSIVRKPVEVDTSSSFSVDVYDVTFLIDTGEKELVVKKRFEYRDDDGEIETIYSFQTFPDSRCTKMLVKLTSTFSTGASGVTVVSYGGFDMKPHPYLDCSYFYAGSDVRLASLLSKVPIETYEEDNMDDISNVLMLSKPDNPFYFPLNNRYTFQSKVIGVAIATTALSQGQFGQFPLYVFTEDGIWAMETAADGSFISQKPLSREVCINPDSICSIDNAVVFVTEKAVMMIQGSQVMNISPYMNGRHYEPNASALSIIEKQEGFDDLIAPISDSDPFMKFMRDAKVAYDYTGQRLVFISESNKGFQYVYKLDTQTWHKVSFGLSLDSPLNSYPEALVTGEGEYTYTQQYLTHELPFDITQQEVDDIYDYVIPSNYNCITSPSLFVAENLIAFANGSLTRVDITGSDINQFVEDLMYYSQGFDISRIHILSEERPGTRTNIYDLSTVLDASRNQDTAKGILITRPFDLGMPDVYKSITSIKIRGDYDKGNIKYILQGSDDGRNFYTLNSLRGKSWKMFRIFILADLEPTERISWIDVDFEPRYNNKLR